MFGAQFCSFFLNSSFHLFHLAHVRICINDYGIPLLCKLFFYNVSDPVSDVYRYNPDPVQGGKMTLKKREKTKKFRIYEELDVLF